MEVGYKAGYAKSGRSSCHSCKGAIALYQLRLGKNTPSTFFDGYQLVWHHPSCLIKREKGAINSDKIEGFDNLKFDDQQKIRGLLGEKQVVQDEQAIASNKKFWEVRNIIASLSLPHLKTIYNGCPTTGGSSRLIFKCTDGIVFGVATCPGCNKVGEMNYMKGTYKCEALLDWGKCGYTGTPQSVATWKFPSSVPFPASLRNIEKLPRNVSGDTDLNDQEEERGDDNDNEGISEEEEDEDEDLEDEGGEEDGEDGEETPAPATSFLSFGSNTTFLLPPSTNSESSDKLLAGFTFAQAGRLSLPKRQIRQLISSNGGVYSGAINQRVNYVLTTCAEVERGRKKIKQAQGLGIPIVLELYLHRLLANREESDASPYVLRSGVAVPLVGGSVAKQAKKAAPKKTVAKKSVFPAKPKKTVAKKTVPSKMAIKKSVFPTKKSAFKAKIPVFKTKTPAFEPAKKEWQQPLSPKKAPPPAKSFFSAPLPASTTPPATGGVVDPEAKCHPSSRIFVDGNDVYNVMLNQTDITSGVNKYFKLQLIDVESRGINYVLFVKWGRVGTDIGMSMRKDFAGKASAIAAFAEKYKDKAGNDWSARSNFVKKPGKYFPVMMEDENPASPPPPQPTSTGTRSGAKVDVHVGLTNVHVLEDDGIIYDAMLNQTNIGANNNKFYVIQVIANNNNNYWTFNRWGRVGEKGQQSLSSTGSNKNTAIAQFKKKFQEKTMNQWEQRANFKPVPGKYTLMQMAYDEEPERPLATPDSTVKSSLDSAVHDLVNLIFDVRMMNQTLADLNIDVKKMPLGRISKSQILMGYDILTKIDTSLKQPTSNRGELTMLTNQFYTLIPHDFGRKIPELIDNVNLLKLKMKQMETLIEIQVASALMAEAAASGIHPTDAKYKKLGTKISVLPSGSMDFQMIHKYLRDTYEVEDSPYSLELENVFVIDRDGEEARFEPFRQLQRQLLWHGSRLSNWISQGLRIAPPEAPKTGYMFGKGVYFGDMVAKSAEYCFTTPSSNTGLLLLSKVALGNSFQVTQPHYMEKAPESFHSCHALAKTMPDPSDEGLMSDMVTKVPYGRGVPSNVPDAFLSHGEFVVYDVGQINMKYLLRVKFHHK